MTDLTGRTAIVTGGARGIGAAVCRLLIERGANVLIADIIEADARALAEELGGRALFQPLDVTDEEQWKAAVATAVDRFGGLYGLINCAGILVIEPIVSLDRAVYEKVLQINLVGTFLGIKYSAPAMKAGGGGAIVNLSSTEGLQGSSFMAAYASSKWGVRGLTKVAAMELGPWGITANSIHPGPVDTPMVNPTGKPAAELSSLAMLDLMPIRRVAQPSEIAHACLYFLDGTSSFVTGSELAIDGGLSLGMFVKDIPGA